MGGTPAPLFYVSPGQINFQVPGATPVGRLEEIQVARVSTGQVLASWLFQIDTESPGLFTVDGSGSGQLVALNQDGSLNNGANPAKAGSIVTLYATGQGAVSGMPQTDRRRRALSARRTRPRFSSIRASSRPAMSSSRGWLLDSRVFGRLTSKCLRTRPQPM